MIREGYGVNSGKGCSLKETCWVFESMMWDGEKGRAGWGKMWEEEG